MYVAISGFTGIRINKQMIGGPLQYNMIGYRHLFYVIQKEFINIVYY